MSVDVAGARARTRLELELDGRPAAAAYSFRFDGAEGGIETLVLPRGMLGSGAAAAAAAYLGLRRRGA